MKRFAFFAAVCLILCQTSIYAGSFSYFSVSERDRNGDRVPFNPGLSRGFIHSNDSFYFTRPDTISGVISTAQDSFLFADNISIDDLQFTHRPLYNMREFELPERAETLRNNARWIDGQGR